MRRAMLLFSFVLLSIAATAQTQINPVTQVNWTAVTGTTTPTRYCPVATTGSTVNGSPVVTVAVTTDVMANQMATGSGVPSGATVVSVNATTHAVTLSVNATTTASGVSLAFRSLGMPYTNIVTGMQYQCTTAGWTANTATDPTKLPLTGGTLTGALNGTSASFTGTVTVNSAPAYSAHIGPLGTMAASWNFDTTTAASACASIGCASGGLTSFAAPSGSWPTWLVPTVTNSTSTPSLAVAATSTGSGSVVLSASPTFTGTPTAPTAAATDNTTQLATDAFVYRAISSLANTPAWLTMLGDGSDGSCVVGTSCMGSSASTLQLSGEYYFTNFTVPAGTTVDVIKNGTSLPANTQSVVIHATGACTVAGTIDASSGAWTSDLQSSLFGYGGGSGGANSGAGASSYASSPVSTPGGLVISGVGNSMTMSMTRQVLNYPGNPLAFGGATGGVNSVGNTIYGIPGSGITLICGSFTASDGTNTGKILAYGGSSYTYMVSTSSPAVGGSGGGVIIISSQASIPTLPATSVSGGPGEGGTAVLSTPVNGTHTTATTGGSCAASTTYWYRVAALEGPNGISLPSTETSIATGGSTSTNIVTVKWTSVYGATGYNIYGRTTGGEQLIGTVGIGATTPSYVDTCSNSPSGALPGANTTSGWYSSPQAVATGGSCTTEPTALLTVSSGGISGGCTVIKPGSGCGTGTGINWIVVGGGGTGGTVTPTWSSGSMVSCTASGGSGYTNTTANNSYSGGNGGNGIYAVFQGW